MILSTMVPPSSWNTSGIIVPTHVIINPAPLIHIPPPNLHPEGLCTENENRAGLYGGKVSDFKPEFPVFNYQ